jgi:crotonobetaine/carnitine-CoA ligase
LLFPHVLDQRARDHPDRVFIEDTTGRRLTYRALHDAALRWAGAYRRLGVGPGDTVVTMLPMGFEFYYSWLGLAWLGSIEVPINTDYRGTMLIHALNNSGARVILTEARFLDRFTEIVGQLDTKATLVLVDADRSVTGHSMSVMAVEEFLNDMAPAEELTGPDIWDIASILYTSGTTGPSKGVIVPWGQLHLLATLAYPMDEFGEEDCFYLPMVTYHVGAKSVPYLMALLNGRVVIRDRFSASEFLDDIARHGCTITAMVAAIAQLMSTPDPKPSDADTPLRYALMAPIPPNVDEFQRRFGIKVCTAYAMTELSPAIGSTGWNATNANHSSCGQVRTGFEVRIVDEHDMEVPIGDVGELIVRTEAPWMLNQGYFRMPDATVRAWRNGWFHTGDCFRRDANGNYYFLDRIKDAIRRRGENISSFEVEGIVNSHPDVVETAAVAVPSDLVEDEVKVVVVRRPGSGLTEEALIRYLIPIMPRFMVPRYVEFVEALPKTPTDRVQKVKLRDEGITAGTWDRERAGVEIPR